MKGSESIKIGISGVRRIVGNWFHIRASNTEPVLRVVAEGLEGEAESIVAGLEKKIKNMEE